MITVEEAQNIISELKPEWGTEKVRLTDAVGRVLAEEVYADRDFPPFDRVAMDGIAFRFSTFEEGLRDFKVQGTQLAGEPAHTLKDDSYALEIMTGAILADGCDVVVRYEDLEFYEAEGEKYVRVLVDDIVQWKNVHRQGSDELKGGRLVAKEQLINSALVSVLATVGRSEVLVRRLPKVAVVSTGDELVDVDEMPLPHQIRKSNVVLIQAELVKMGVGCECFHLGDHEEELRLAIRDILDKYDVVLMSGGVSKGKADYLPSILDELGVNKLFHRVSQKPGKPFWYGVYEDRLPVFAFPGNPISTMICFKYYFLNWLGDTTGRVVPRRQVRLSKEVIFKPDLAYFLQVESIHDEKGDISVVPRMGNGSGDLANLSVADAFVYLPKSKEVYEKGEWVDWFSL